MKKWNPGFPYCLKQCGNLVSPGVREASPVWMVDAVVGQYIIFECEKCKTRWKSDKPGQLEELTEAHA